MIFVTENIPGFVIRQLAHHIASYTRMLQQSHETLTLQTHHKTLSQTFSDEVLLILISFFWQILSIRRQALRIGCR